MPIFWCAIVQTFGEGSAAKESLEWGPHAVLADDSERAVKRTIHMAAAETPSIPATHDGYEVQVRDF